MTYEEADELIELAPSEEIELNILYDLMNKRRLYRKNNGAIFIEQPQGRLYIENNKVDLRVIENSKSRFMVSECMILFGAIVAEYASEHNIPIPFRTQQKSSLDTLSFHNYEMIQIKNSLIKQSLEKARTELIPKPHFTLGLDCYAQATSPIRRYLDLLVHRQLIGFLTDSEIYNKEHMDQIIGEINKGVKQANQITNEDKRELQKRWFNQSEKKYWTV